MKKIGFIDYYISEWHANNYPRWIAQANEKLGTDYKVSYVWAELDVSPRDNVSTDEWCKNYGAERCGSIAELCEKSDAVIILAPSDCEKHLQYASEALPFGKPTYIDKTFAENFDVAKQIFDIAAKYGTKFFSSSALRYCDELEALKNADNYILTAGGSLFEEYIIHPIEMAVLLLEDAAKRVKIEKQGAQKLCSVETISGKHASIVFAAALPYIIAAEDKDGNALCQNIESSMFVNMLADIIRFFDSGEVSFDVAQTLEAMRFRDGLLKADECPGQWIEI